MRRGYGVEGRDGYGSTGEHCYASFPAKAIIDSPNKELSVIVIAQNALLPLYQLILFHGTS